MLTSSIDINRHRQSYYYCTDVSASVNNLSVPKYSYYDINGTLNWGLTGSVEIVNHSGTNSYNGATPFTDTAYDSTTQGAIPDMINAGQILKIHLVYDTDGAGVGNNPNDIKFLLYNNNNYNEIVYSSSMDFSTFPSVNYLDPHCFFYEDRSLSNCIWAKIVNDSTNSAKFIADKLTISIIAMGHREII